MLRLIVFLCILSSSVANSQTSQERVLEIRTAIKSVVEKLTTQISDQTTTRDLSNAALFLFEIKQDKAKAEQWLMQVLKSQNMNPQSPDYGKINWQINDDKVDDENAIEFASAAWAPLLILHASEMSQGLVSEIKKHISATLVALKRHCSDQSRKKVAVFYTNIFLMNSINLLLLSEVINDTKNIDLALRQLNLWVDYTRQNGIHEYDSPTYYAVDVGMLSTAFALVKNQNAKKQFKWALDFFWADLAANYFEGRESLSGAHSRDYDFLAGRGGIDLFYYIENLSHEVDLKSIDLEKVYLLIGKTAPQAYQIPAHDYNLANQKNRWVQSTYLNTKNKVIERSNYITPSYSISSSSDDYGPQDKTITWEYNTGYHSPVAYILSDTLDEPYGKIKIQGKDGHRKVRHESLQPFVLQDHELMLATLNINLKSTPAFSSLATNWVFPYTSTEIYVNDQYKELKLNEKINFDTATILTIKLKNVCTLMRFFEIQSLNDMKPSIYLQYDESGKRNNVARLAIYHYQGALKDFKKNALRVGFVSETHKCESLNEVKKLIKDFKGNQLNSIVNEKSDHHHWNIVYQSKNKTYEIDRFTDKEDLSVKKINQVIPQKFILGVNGSNLVP